MKNLKRILLLFIILFGSSTIMFAQTYEEYVKAEKEKLDKFKLEEEQGLADLRAEFNKFVERADKEFSEFLGKPWEEYETKPAEKVPELPKPIIIPKHREQDLAEIAPPKQIALVIPDEAKVIRKIKPLLPVIQKTEENTDFLKSSVEVEYYGTKQTFSYADKLAQSNIQRITEQAIAKWWTMASKTNYNSLVNQLLLAKKGLNLNDWAYYMLVSKTAVSISNSDHNKAQLLTWFLMTRSGYKAKIAFNDNSIYILLPTANKLYGKTFLKINNETYYITGEKTSEMFYTYDFHFPGAERVIDFNIEQPLNIGDDVYERKVSFLYKGDEYSFPVKLNIQTLFMMKEYPVTDLQVFFNAAMSEVSKQSLAEGLMPHLSKMEPQEAINFLLAFVQKSFVYQTDQEQFNEEKFFFPEELFFYSASDCEDRSALFIYLAKQLLHLDVIGLKYSDHVAAAVRLGEDAAGDYVIFNDVKYIITDPTYVNAPMGLCMPQYKNETAKIVETKSLDFVANSSKELWKLSNDMGGYRGSNLADAKFDTKGNCYLTGYYTDELNMGTSHWKSENGKRQAFIAKFNSENVIQWVQNLTSSEIATSFSLILDEEENPVIAGSFSGEMNSGSHKLTVEENKEDIFIASYNAVGDLQWLKKSGLDTISQTSFLNYVVKFDIDGKHINSKLYFDNASEISKGVFYSEHLFTIVGGINSTTGFGGVNSISFNAANDFNTIDYLKEESDALVIENVDKSIAGLVAVINLIKSQGMVIPGSEAQQALDVHNQEFKSSSPSIYENIGNVTFMKNDDGIINVKTKNRKSVSFDKIKISDGARIKVSPSKDGNDQIDIISGIEVGKAFVWYDLNFVKIINKTGDLLFDYDSDHTQKTINMQNDILD